MSNKISYEGYGDYTYLYPRPQVTATVVLFDSTGRVLIGRRWMRTRAFPGFWCLPGGFLEAKSKDCLGETIEHTACREVLEETGVSISQEQLQLFDVNSDPAIDPRGHTVNVCYYAVLTPQQIEQVQAGDDLDEVKWVEQEEINNYEFAFNHGYEIIPKGIAKFKKEQLDFIGD